VDLAGGPTGLGVLVIVTAAAAGMLGVLSLLVVGRIDSSRSILVHAPVDRAWTSIRHFPTLHARHGKAGDFGRIEEWTLRHGDGVHAGSIWRGSGTWGVKPYWADVEIVWADPGRAIAFSLRRDSLGTHRGLRHHMASLRLEHVATGTTKVSWRLRAHLRGPRLILERLRASARLRARLLDQGLRSLKVEIDRSTRPAPEETLPSGDALDDVAAPLPPGRPPPETTV